jgi:hypothetical protein
MNWASDIKKQKNTKIIISVLKEEHKIKRGDLYRKVMEKQLQKYNKKTTYQTISRDVERLLKMNIIKVIDGGPRSQILSLNK